mmetsp:Transcript_7428/g.12392  ORF Transcript_7428/g.12392 Transcript_7428/m.12392 type:complete len:86 (+) Transcript_7428:149-406(+)
MMMFLLFLMNACSRLQDLPKKKKEEGKKSEFFLVRLLYFFFTKRFIIPEGRTGDDKNYYIPDLFWPLMNSTAGCTMLQIIIEEKK